ncbi:MAG: putative selenate reductase subunit YgfK, partial [Spirochaetes bacterium]|nr:putative selenate reductase subunit YgfK [Spirochaetota bacterium]
NSQYQKYLDQINAFIKEETLFKDQFGSKQSALSSLTNTVSTAICTQITLSTMHGCPPKEIEAICMYMLTEKKINTYVKLNPTLLGYDFVRKVMDQLGFTYLQLKEDTFLHDLQYNDALAMLKRLKKTSVDQNLSFGIKLTNTLASVNSRGILPGEENYMSGRALFPLSITLAARLSKEFNGELPISYSGGAAQHNVRELFACGIRPITLATDMLKPGGYVRMKEMADILEKESHWDKEKIDVSTLQKLADDALTNLHTSKHWRGTDKINIDQPLPLFDCYVAPCVTACPIHQDIPEYISLVSQGKYKEALDVIYEKNALPSMTGHICDHQCMYNCTRLDYEGSVKVREMKKIAVKNGFNEYKASWKKPAANKSKKAAVIGAGPAGLSTAYFLAREGFSVTVFDKRESAGGVVRHIIPRFRLPEEAILHDINFVEAHGVKFKYGTNPEFTVNEVKKQGYEYVCLALGAEAVKPFPLKGDNRNVIPSLKFLDNVHKNAGSLNLGKNVVVVGGGNTAMDSSRAALQADGTENVAVVYRRTENEMPADREEYEEAVHDGVKFYFLANPEEFTSNGKVVCRKMKLGEPDESGRRRPVATDEVMELACDTLITAIGENVDLDILKKSGVPLASNGWPQASEDTLEVADNVYLIGDAHTGPSTIVECIAEGRKAADAICKKEDSSWSRDPSFKKPFSQDRVKAIKERKGQLADAIDPKSKYQTTDFAKLEGKRCLECTYLCNKCVDVCPNRANMALKSVTGLADPYQIIHIDAYCNECGNCGSFCPYHGKPYLDKLTIFSLEEDFNNSKNSGFFINGENLKLRLKEKIYDLKINAQGQISGTQPSGLDAENTFKMISEVMVNHQHLLGKVDL